MVGKTRFAHWYFHLVFHVEVGFSSFPFCGRDGNRAGEFPVHRHRSLQRISISVQVQPWPPAYPFPNGSYPPYIRPLTRAWNPGIAESKVFDNKISEFLSQIHAFELSVFPPLLQQSVERIDARRIG